MRRRWHASSNKARAWPKTRTLVAAHPRARRHDARVGLCRAAAWRGAVGRDDVIEAMAARRRRFDRYPTRVREATLAARADRHHGRAGRAGQWTGGDRDWPASCSAIRCASPPRCDLGEGDVVDIEREIELGGALHSKGVLILAVIPCRAIRPRSPLSVAASLVFEQSYGRSKATPRHWPSSARCCPHSPTCPSGKGWRLPDRSTSSARCRQLAA